MDVVDAFVVKLGLDPRDYQREIKNYRDDRKRLSQEDQRYNRDQQDSQRRLTQGFRQMRTEAVGFLTVLAGASTVQQFASNLMQGDAATGRFAANMGLATERVGAWEEAVKRAGGTAQEGRALIGSMASAFQSLQLTGSTGHDADLKGLGVTAQDLASPEQALLRIAEASQRMPRAEFTARLQRLGVSDAGITLLSKSRAELEKTLVEMEQMGVASDKSAKDAIAFDNALQDIEQTIKGKARPAIAGFAEALANAADDQETLNIVSNIGIGILGAMALAVIGATWPWLALAGAIAGAVAAYQSWNNRGEQTTGEWAAGGIRHAAQWAADSLGINIKGGGEGRLAYYNRGRDAMGNPIGTGGGPTGEAEPGSLLYYQSRLSQAGGGGDRITAFFKSRGYTDAQARGIAAGIHAESGGNPRAFNRAGGGQGAFGIGQWRGDRLKRLRARYGNNPTLDQQLAFLDWELRGGDAGGKGVLQATTAEGALSAYIGGPGWGFMRPDAAGRLGDMRRGMAYLNGGRGGGGAGAQTVNNNTTVGTVIVNTAATDAKGIARDMRGALSQRSVVTQANTGLTG